MSTGNNIFLAEKFLRNMFAESDYFKGKDTDRTYRFEHSCRVANIGMQIARAEGLDTERTAVACLLHDVSYCMTFADRADIANHGRYSAAISRPFVQTLGYSDSEVNEICFAIAIHADGKADFDGEENAFTLTVGDADNIDRFDAYRIFDTLKYVKYDEMTLDGKIAYVDKMLEKLGKYRNIGFATKTATAMWIEKTDYQTDFYERLRHQNEISVIK